MSESYGATLEEREALLESARSIAPQIREAADEIEAARQLPEHVVDLLKSIGAFRLIQPRWLGGHDADPVTQILFIEAIARADASAAWCVMIGCDSGLISRDLAPDVARRLYVDIDAATCSAAFPLGSARRVEGGYVANGRWPYFSGITHAECVLFVCRRDGPDSSDGAAPEIIRFVVPRSDVAILDTWKTTGMCGTGSNDAEVVDLFVPDERCFPPRASTEEVARDPQRHPIWILPKLLGVPLGLIQAAHEEVVELARERVAVRGALRDDALTQSTIGETAARIAACRAYALASSDEAWRDVCETGALSDRNRADVHLAITWVTSECVQIIEQLYSVAGSSALFTERSSLDRRLRDMHAMNQHVVVGAHNYAAAGRVLQGLPAQAPFW